VPNQNPLGKIKDVATGAAVTVVGTVTETVKDPVGAGHKAVGTGQKVVGTAVGQAVGTGQKVVGTAVGQAVALAGRVSTKVPGLSRSAPPTASSGAVAEPQTEPRKREGDPVAPATKKVATKKTTAKKAAKKAPAQEAAAKTAADLASVDDSSVETPVGTTGADPATNPDTTESDLQQVGTEPLMDPSLTKAIKAEADTGARAADLDKG
jgi:hypothetical protein